MNMFVFELKSTWKSTMIWSSVLGIWIILLSSLFPSFSVNATIITKVLEGYPEAVRNVLGLRPDSFKDFIGYYTFAFQGIVELGAVQAMILGATIIFKEVRGKTADFLFSKPITRQQIMTSKLLAASVSLAITNVIYLVVALVSALLVAPEPINMKIFLMLSMTLLFVQLIFISFGILSAVLFPRMKSATAISIGALFFFMISYDLLKPIMGEYTVRYLIPFEYFSSEFIVKYAAYEAPFIITTILVIVISLATSYFLYARKDVQAS